MLKRAIANAVSNSINLGVTIADVDCSQFTSCGSCIAQEGCGFCGNLGQCVSGGWFGVLDKSTCGLNDYYYHQCHMSTLPLGIISIVLISIIIISVLIGMGIFCCCLCCQCCQGNDVEEEGGQDGEDAPLLGSKYLRRSSTYYQWNRPIPESDKNNKKSKSKKIQQQKKKPSTVTTASTANTTSDAQQIHYLLLPESLPSGGEGGESSNTAKSWEDRRSALLKKYGRDTN